MALLVIKVVIPLQIRKIQVLSAVIRFYLRSKKDCDLEIQNIKVSSRTQIDADKIG